MKECIRIQGRQKRRANILQKTMASPMCFPLVHSSVAHLCAMGHHRVLIRLHRYGKE